MQRYKVDFGSDSKTLQAVKHLMEAGNREWSLIESYWNSYKTISLILNKEGLRIVKRFIERLHHSAIVQIESYKVEG